MGKILIVLTYVYPFSNGEPFIGNERFSWGKFDKILICPLYVKPDHKLRKEYIQSKNEEIYKVSLKKPGFIEIIKSMKGPIGFFKGLQEIEVLVRTHRLNLRNLKMLFSIGPNTNWKALRVEQYIDESNYINNDDSVLVYSYWMYESALVGAGLKLIHPNWRFITRAHRYDLYESERKNKYIPYRKLILDTSDVVYSISDNGKSYLIETNGKEYESKICVSRLGTIKLYNDYAGDCQTKVKIVSCSNLIPVKRVDLIIRGLNIFKKECIWYHFGDGELRNELEDMAKSLPKNVQSIFMGYVSSDEIQDFYACHHIDAFINVSESEGVPVSIMEAQSYGIPVVATDVGGTSEIVHNKENGILLKKFFSSEEFLEALENVLENSVNYRENAKSTWERFSDAQTNYSEMFIHEAEQLSRCVDKCDR